MTNAYRVVIPLSYGFWMNNYPTRKKAVSGLPAKINVLAADGAIIEHPDGTEEWFDEAGELTTTIMPAREAVAV